MQPTSNQSMFFGPRSSNTEEVEMRCHQRNSLHSPCRPVAIFSSNHTIQTTSCTRVHHCRDTTIDLHTHTVQVWDVVPGMTPELLRSLGWRVNPVQSMHT